MTGDFYDQPFDVPEVDCVTMKRIIYPDLGLDPHKVEHRNAFGDEPDIYHKPSEEAFLNDKYIDKTDKYLMIKKLRIPTREEALLEEIGVGKIDWLKDIIINPVKKIDFLDENLYAIGADNLVSKPVEKDILGNTIETDNLSGKRYAMVFGVRTEINICGYPVIVKSL
jgi:hypothetical protein